jgi:hypothetical protein
MNSQALWLGVVIMTGAAAGSLAADTAAAPPPFVLFTDVEAAAWNSGQSKANDFSTRDLSDESGAPTCKSIPNNDADNPQIRVVAPPLAKPLISPLDIDLQFVPTARAPIRADTFRICYLGLLSMDITKRVTDRFTVSPQGLHIVAAQLPPGHHRLALLIADERGRLGRREAVFDIY